MPLVTIPEAESDLSQLIARAEAGEEIVIVRDDVPAVKLTVLPKPPKQKPRLFGAFAGRFPPIPDAFFFDPLPDEELALWEGGAHEDPAR